MDSTKRELRQQKREIKRDGSKLRRRLWKQELAERPEDAPYSEAHFGRYSSSRFNGLDHDSTRKQRGVATSSESSQRSADASQ